MGKQQCLMVETPDKRTFFTKKKHLHQLIEFANTFDAKLSFVKAKDPEVLELQSLADAISDQSYNNITEYEIIEKKVDNNKRKSIINKAAVIKAFIKDEFLKGHVVSTKSMEDHFKHYKVSKACFCNHIKNVRTSMEKEGKSFKKVGGGKYQIK